MSLYKNYPIVLVPIEGKPNHEFTLKEGLKYYEWYLEEMPRRRSVLQSFLDFPLDFSDESLTKLDKWMWHNLESEPGNSNLPAAECTSYGIDIAYYLSEILIKRRPELFWKLNTSKKSVSAFKPVIVGFNLPNKNYFVDYEKDILGCFENVYSFGAEKKDGLLTEMLSNSIKDAV
jgi:hypothetical protein